LKKNLKITERRDTADKLKVLQPILKVSKNAIREISDNALLEKIINSNKKEMEKFDLNLSGCSGTIVI
jgi:hypothetical protein